MVVKSGCPTNHSSQGGGMRARGGGRESRSPPRPAASGGARGQRKGRAKVGGGVTCNTRGGSCCGSNMWQRHVACGSGVAVAHEVPHLPWLIPYVGIRALLPFPSRSPSPLPYRVPYQGRRVRIERERWGARGWNATGSLGSGTVEGALATGRGSPTWRRRLEPNSWNYEAKFVTSFRE